MKKLFVILVLSVLLVLMTGCERQEKIYIEPAQLSAQEEAIAGLLGADTDQRLYDFVGKCKIIRRRIIFICVKIAKQVWNIDVKSATQPTSYVVKTRIGNTRFLQIV